MLEKGNKKVTRAWLMYDWANSVYHLTITTAIFPIYYAGVAASISKGEISFGGLKSLPDALYNYALALAFLVIAGISPLLSGIADYTGNKKAFMRFFCYMGALACSSLFFFTSSAFWVGIVMVIFACIGYAGSIVFYNAYLPEIVEPQDQDRLSAKGFSMGYIGSSILLIINLATILKPGLIGLSGDGAVSMATRISFLTVGAWWVGFAQYTFVNLPTNPYGEVKQVRKNIWKGYQELIKVWNILKTTTRLRRFLMAFFVYNTGVRTIMLVATLFGSDSLHLGSAQLIPIILIIQFVAVGGAFMFSYIAKKKSDIFMLKAAVVIWVAVCIGAYYTYTANEFYGLAIVVGLVMGGIQALSRSTYSKMLPADTMDHASFFSFYDVCENVGSALGLFLYGWVYDFTHDMRNSIVFLLSLFIIGFILLNRIPKYKPVNA
jgi:UMF1 family MFS transporter